MMKKHMTPLTKGGQTVVQKGKGSSQFPPNPAQSGALATMAGGASPQNYAKATPMAQPSPMSAPGIGQGDWSGGGM